MARRRSLASRSAPFVLTLEMDGEAFAALDALRRRYYAPERNLVPGARDAVLPAAGRSQARDQGAASRRQLARGEPIDIEPGEARAMERGVAIS